MSDVDNALASGVKGVEFKGEIEAISVEGEPGISIPVRAEEKREEHKFIQYKPVRPLGGGGMGNVWLVEDTMTPDRQKVVLKCLKDEIDNDPEALKRLGKEMETVRTFTHQNIVDVHSMVKEEIEGKKRWCILMEYIEGQTLSDILKEKGSLTPHELCKMAISVCNALSFAHSKGVIHRDIKPSNIMVSKDGEVKITDFGIASAIKRDPYVSRSVSTILTLQYASPEQINEEKQDARSDIYSLGITLYECLTGIRPFSGKGPKVLLGHLNTIPEPPSKKKQDIPKQWDKIILKCLEKRPEDRYQTMEKLLEALREIA